MTQTSQEYHISRIQHCEPEEMTKYKKNNEKMMKRYLLEPAGTTHSNLLQSDFLTDTKRTNDES